MVHESESEDEIPIMENELWMNRAQIDGQDAGQKTGQVTVQKTGQVSLILNNQ